MSVALPAAHPAAPGIKREGGGVCVCVCVGGGGGGGGVYWSEGKDVRLLSLSYIDRIAM